MSTRSSLAVLALVLASIAAVVVLVLGKVGRTCPVELPPQFASERANIERNPSRTELASDVVAPSSSVETRADARDVAASTDSTDLYITGFLREPSGKRVVGNDVNLVLTSPNWKQTATPDANGAFVFGPFLPGSFDLAVRSRRHESADLHVDLVAADARRVREIVLVPHVEILVRARTPEGQPLARAMMSSSEFGYSFRARVVAREPLANESNTAHAPPEWIGRYVGIGGTAEEWTGADEPIDAIGKLYVPKLPVVASLRLGERVIDSVTANTNDVVFVLPLERMSAALTTIRAIATDVESRSGAPLLDAWIRVGDGDGHNFTVEGTNHEGLLEIRGLPDGPAPIRIGAPGHVTAERGIFLQGGTIDLGPIALERTVVVRGRVFDEEGNPVDHVLELVPRDSTRNEEPIWISSRATAPFEVELAPGKYVVRSAYRFPDPWNDLSNEERVVFLEHWQPAYLPIREIELTRTTNDELELHLVPAHRIDFDLQPTTGLVRLTIETREGLPVSRLDPIRSVHLPPGDYRVKWTRAENDVITRDFTVSSGPMKLHLP